MEKELTDEKLEKAVDILELCALALKFYTATREVKYLNELESAVNRLSSLIAEEGDLI